MAEYDATEFIDTDFQAHKSPFAAASSAADPLRAPTRDEVDRKVVEAQQKLAELKHAQEDLERERAALEELRRRQLEFQNGRQEMVQNLTRGLGLLEEAEFNARRDSEQMTKTMADFRDALEKIQNVRDETWTKENFQMELTRALTIVENARMEWNSARLKLTALEGESAQKKSETESAPQPAVSPFANLSFGELCKIGFAMTWPLLVGALGALGIFAAILLRH
jgi:chromosome segregation ATPase